MYARNAGIMGKIHGATNDPSPANAATAKVISATNQICDFSFKAFFHIYPQCYCYPFLTRLFSIFSMNKRFIIVGIVLGIVVTLAVIIGSPAIGGFDAMR